MPLATCNPLEAQRVLGHGNSGQPLLFLLSSSSPPSPSRENSTCHQLAKPGVKRGKVAAVTSAHGPCFVYTLHFPIW